MSAQSPVINNAADGEPNQKSHVFAVQENTPGGRLVRTIGIVRARARIGLANLVYNIRRLVILERIAKA